MPLPTDNETEGVIITAAPPSIPTPPPPPIVGGPGLMQFTQIFRERSLWRAILTSLGILFLIYQTFSYTYIGTSDWWYFNCIGDGWHSTNSTGNYGYWTSSTGTIYFRNLGYPFTDHKLTVFVASYDNPTPAYTHTVTISVGSQTVLTLEAKGLIDKEVPLSAEFLRTIGLDPMVTISDETQYPPGTGGEHGIAFSGASLNPVDISLWSPALPPVALILLFPLLTLLSYSIARRRKSAKASFAQALYAFYPLFAISASLRTLLFLGYAIILVIIAVYAFYRWRRELANWILHLRHPADERFIVR